LFGILVSCYDAGMQMIRVLATNTVVQMIGKVVTAGTTLLITRMIADGHSLGRLGFGEFSIITAYAAYFYILTDFGLNAVGTKHLTEHPEHESMYFSQILVLRLAGSIGLILLGLIFLVFLPYAPVVKLGCILMLLTIFSQAIITHCNMLFQVRLRYDQSMIAVSVGSLVSLALVFLAYKAGASLLVYIAAMTVGSLLSATMAIFLASLMIPIRPSISVAVWRTALVAALPLGVTVALNLVYFKADAFILSFIRLAPVLHLNNADAVAVYGLAYRIFEVALVFPIFLVNALYPLMVKTAKDDYGAFRRLVGKSLIGLAAISFMAMGLLFALSPWLIALASKGNAEFSGSITALRLLVLSLPLFFMSNVLLWTVMALGRQRVLVVFYAIGAIINVALNIWLIPVYGYVAAAIVTGLTEGVTTFLLAVSVWSLLKNPPQLPAHPMVDPQEVERVLVESVYD
jgi:O-antigen/teichoic acid export membrane protein